MDSWMNKLPDTIKGKTINRIVLPGSHDSCAYKIDIEIPTLSPTFEKIRKYAKFSYPLELWTKTQKLSIYEQLMSGIRYLDLRISKLNGNFYGSHTFACVQFANVLDQIADFTKDHLSEILILDLSYDHENKSNVTDAVSTELCELVKTHRLYQYCYDIKNDKLPTYTEMIAKNTPILLVLDDMVYGINTIKALTYKGRIKNWTNSQSACDNTIRILSQLYSLKKVDDVITIFEETVTPADNNIIDSIIYISTSIVVVLIYLISLLYMLAVGSESISLTFALILTFAVLISINYYYNTTYISLEKATNQVKGTLVAILAKQKEMIEKISIISGDFVDNNFAQSVIDLNK